MNERSRTKNMSLSALDISLRQEPLPVGKIRDPLIRNNHTVPACSRNDTGPGLFVALGSSEIQESLFSGFRDRGFGESGDTPLAT